MRYAFAARAFVAAIAAVAACIAMSGSALAQIHLPPGPPGCSEGFAKIDHGPGGFTCRSAAPTCSAVRVAPSNFILNARSPRYDARSHTFTYECITSAPPG